MEVTIAAACCVLAALWALGREVRRLRAEALDRLEALRAAMELLERNSGRQAPEEPGQALGGPDPAEGEEPRVSAELQEGFDNLMRYSVGTARGKDHGPR